METDGITIKKEAVKNRTGIIPYPIRPGYVLTRGERSELVSILQLMLGALSINYDIPHVALSGEYDDITSDSVKLFQKLNLLDESGDVDGVTWDRLAEEYNRTVNDNQ